jgi:hypothetical protein
MSVTRMAADVTIGNLRDRHRSRRIAECDRSSELAVARGFVEDVMPHLRARRLNAVLV